MGILRLERVSKLFVVDREDVIEVGEVIPVEDGIPFKRAKRTGTIPESRVTKQIETGTRQRAVLFEIDYTDINSERRPSYRSVPSFSQMMEPYNSDVQYLLFSAGGYQTIAFKVPNIKIVKAYQEMDWINKKYKNQVFFEGPNAGALIQPKLPPHTPLHGLGYLKPPL